MKQIKVNNIIKKAISLFYKIKNSIISRFAYILKLNFHSRFSCEKDLSLKYFYLNLLSKQIKLFALLISGFIGYCHMEWNTTRSTEINHLKLQINQNISHYTKIIDLITKRIEREGINTADLLSAKRYNQLFSYDKNFVHLNNIYIITDDKSKIIYGQTEKEEFVIPPSEEFFNLSSQIAPEYQIQSISKASTQTQASVHIKVENNFIFIGKHIEDPKTQQKLFLIIRIEVKKFIEEICKQLDITGTVTVVTLTHDSSNVHKRRGGDDESLNTENQNDLISIHPSIPLAYESDNFIVNMLNKAYIIGFSLVILIASIIICLWQTRSFNQNFVNYFEHKINKNEKKSMRLKSNNLSLSKQLQHIRYAFTQSIKIYDYYISSLNVENLTNLQFNEANQTPEESYINLTQAVKDSIAILYLKLSQGRLTCEIKVLANKSVKLTNPAILPILVLNFVIQAAYRSPKLNKIIVELGEDKNFLVIKIEDYGFDFVRNQSDIKDFSLLNLSDEVLSQLAKQIEIEIVKISYSEQHHATLLKINPKNYRNIDITQVGNVLYPNLWS